MGLQQRLNRIEARAAVPEEVPVRVLFWLPVKNRHPEIPPDPSHRPAGVCPVEGVPGAVIVKYETGRPDLLPSPYREQQAERERRNREAADGQELPES